LQIDGSFFSGSTDDASTTQNCISSTLAGQNVTRCSSSLLQACQFSGISDLMSYVSCTLNNALQMLKSLSLNLFVPDWTDIKTFFGAFVVQAQTSLGFLYAPINFLTALFNLVVNQATNPTGDTCDLGPITIFGASAHIAICEWRYQFPQLWNYMQLFIQGGIAFGFSVAFWRKFNSFFGNHIEDHDGSSEQAAEDTSGYRWYDDRTGDSGSIHDGSAGRRK
jgi:hypothetical protein